MEKTGMDKAFELLLESINDSTEEVYALRQREIILLQQLLDANKKITMLIEELAESKLKT